MRSCFRGQRAERAHVVEPIGELDEDDADVLRHGQEHLPDVLRLLLLMGPGAELGQLGDAVHEVRDLRAEPLLDVRQRVLGVLGDVVKQRRLDSDRVEAQLREHLGDGERVAHVRLAADALLIGVRVRGEGEGGGQRSKIRLRVALPYFLLHLLQLALHPRRREVLRRHRPSATLGASLAARPLGGGA